MLFKMLGRSIFTFLHISNHVIKLSLKLKFRNLILENSADPNEMPHVTCGALIWVLNVCQIKYLPEL